jgi:hypothetical protein
MSLDLEKVIFSTKKKFLLQNIIEKHQIGKILTEEKFKSTPHFVVIEKIEESYKSEKNDILQINIEFNTELGGFSGITFYKHFLNTEEVDYCISLNKWLGDKLKANSNIEIPKIHGKGKKFILYEGFNEKISESSSETLLKKSKLAGEIP